MQVALVRIPSEAARLSRLREEGRARLIVVEDGQIPKTTDCLEDWVGPSAGEAEIKARMWTLAQRSDAHVTGTPAIDEHGVLRLDGQWVSLPPVECRIAQRLLDSLGEVVPREDLSKAGWPEGSSSRNALDVHVLRLRRRIKPVGLRIETVRAQGYLMERSGP